MDKNDTNTIEDNIIDLITEIKSNFIYGNNFLSSALLLKMIHEDKKGIRVVDIARRINISPPSVTEALSKLEKKGYVKKIEGEDRREKILSITKKGEERMKKFTEFMRLEMKEKMSVLTDDEKKKLEKSLSNIVNILHKVK